MGENISTDEGLHLIVIGAGLAGLSAALSTKLANPAHRVTVLETVKELQEVGVRSQVHSLSVSTTLHYPISLQNPHPFPFFQLQANPPNHRPASK